MVLSAGEDRAAFLAAGFLKLPFSARHAEVMESLLSHHADPFAISWAIRATARYEKGRASPGLLPYVFRGDSKVRQKPWWCPGSENLQTSHLANPCKHWRSWPLL